MRRGFTFGGQDQGLCLVQLCANTDNDALHKSLPSLPKDKSSCFSQGERSTVHHWQCMSLPSESRIRLAINSLWGVVVSPCHVTLFSLAVYSPEWQLSAHWATGSTDGWVPAQPHVCKNAAHVRCAMPTLYVAIFVCNAYTICCNICMQCLHYTIFVCLVCNTLYCMSQYVIHYVQCAVYTVVLYPNHLQLWKGVWERDYTS